MRMDGSGLDPELRLDQQPNVILVTGLTQEDTINHSLTIEKLLK
jgi:hypothetical protein